MKTIYKYQLSVEDKQTFGTHKGADILHIGVQHKQVCLWVLVDTAAPRAVRVVEMRGTGHGADGLSAGLYIGTFMLDGGTLVFHAFDGGEE